MDWLLLLQKLLASGFILVVGALLLLWCQPQPQALREWVHRHCGRWVLWAGLDNFWGLFAPNPVSRNLLIGFELEFADGSRRPWPLPEFTLRDGYQATRHLRYVKWHNQLLSQHEAVPREAICRYVLQAFQDRHPGAALPVRVHLLRFYEPGPPALLPWLSQIAYSYTVVEPPSRST